MDKAIVMDREDRIPLIDVSETSRQDEGYKVIEMSCLAKRDVLGELEEGLRKEFPFLKDSIPYDDKFIHKISFEGNAGEFGDHFLSLENVKCPLPMLIAQVHNLSIRARSVLAERFTTYLRRRFQEYSLDTENCLANLNIS